MIHKYLLLLLSLFLLFSCGLKKNLTQSNKPHTFIKANDTISVMSFNIRSCRPIGKKFAEIDSTAAAIARYNPDIVFLQEVDKNSRRSLNQDEAQLLAKKTGLVNFYFVKGINEEGGEFGDAIITRFPIIDQRGVLLPKVPVKGRYVEQRDLNILTLKLPSGNSICAACSHFCLTQQNRTPQAYKVIEELSAIKLPVIFGADLNDEPGGETLNILKSAFTLTCKKNNSYTFPVPIPKNQIDFIMYRPANQFRLISHCVCLKELYASDHFPILAKIVVFSK